MLFMTQNKNGLVAGNGIVNGSNGNNGGNHRDVSIWGAWFAVFVALIIIFGLVAIANPPKGKIVVDGMADDWKNVLKTGEAKEFKNPVDEIYGSPYNMNKLMICYDNARKILYFAVSFDSSFGYAKDEPHTLHFLIDSDANDATGYFVKFGNQVLGVDYWGECVIYNDEIQTVGIYPYSGKGTDWLWDSSLGGRGSKSDDGTFIELSYPMNDFSDDSRVFVITKIGYAEYPSGIYAIGYESALVYKHQYGDTYRIKICYLTDNPKIAYISFTIENATLMENGEVVCTGREGILMPSKGDIFNDGETRNLTVSYDLSATLDVENVAADPKDIITVIGEKFVGYKGSDIKIDGNFDDWSSVNKFQDSDKVSYGNADIVEYAHVSTSTKVYLYVKVNGIAMGGAYIPMVYKPPAGEGGGGAGNITETNPGEDYMKITLHLTDGSQKVVEIKGKYGEINSVTIDGVASKKVKAERGGQEGNKIEVGVYDLESSMLYYEIEIKGQWCNIGDYASIRIVYVTRSTYHSINVNGDLSDWDNTTELMGTQNGHSLYITWNATHIFIGYAGCDFGGYGDLFIYFDSINGGSNQTSYWNGVHTLPFYADYTFCVEDRNYYELRFWNGTEWITKWNNSNKPSSVSTYIGWSGNTNTEIALPFSEIGITDPANSSLSMLVYEQYEDSGDIYIYWPNQTSRSSGFPQYYCYPSLSLSMAPNDTQYIVTTNEIYMIPAIAIVAFAVLWVRRFD